MLVFAFRPPNTCAKFQQDRSMHTRVMQSVRNDEEKRRNFYEIVLTHILGTVYVILLKFETLPPLHGG